MQHSVFLTCNFLQKVLAKNTLRPTLKLNNTEAIKKAVIKMSKNRLNAFFMLSPFLFTEVFFISVFFMSVLKRLSTLL